MLDPRFPAVIGTGFFGGGILASMMRRLYKEGEERKANIIFLAVMLVVCIPTIAKYTYDVLTGDWKIGKMALIFASAYLIGYGIFLVKSGGVENETTAPPKKIYSRRLFLRKGRCTLARC